MDDTTNKKEPCTRKPRIFRKPRGITTASNSSTVRKRPDKERDMTSVKDLFPESIPTPRLTLELYKHSPAHIDTLLAAVNSATSHRHQGDFGVRTPAQWDAFGRRYRVRDERFRGGVADADIYYLLRRPAGDLIGGVSLCQRVAKSGAETVVLPPDIGWCLVEGQMGKGYATEAAGALLRCLREELDRKDVIVFASDENRASNRVAEKLGFVDGGQCPNLDRPGSMLALFILPGMERMDEKLKEGLGFSI